MEVWRRQNATSESTISSHGTVPVRRDGDTVRHHRGSRATGDFAALFHFRNRSHYQPPRRSIRSDMGKKVNIEMGGAAESQWRWSCMYCGTMGPWTSQTFAVSTGEAHGDQHRDEVHEEA